MTVAQSLVSFGDYLFPIGARIDSRQASTDVEETKMLGLDGTIAPAGVLAAQIIQLDIEIGGGGDVDPSSTDMDLIYLRSPDQLNNALNNMFAQLEQGYQPLTIGYTPARTIQAQKRKLELKYMEGTARRHATASLEFYAPDPRWLSVASHTLAISGDAATNAGNMISYPVVTYTQTGGAASAPVSLKVYTGNTSTPYIELSLNLTLQSGDVLVINCDPRQRAQGIIYTPSGMSPVNGLYLLGTTGITNTVGNDATFPYLVPGADTVDFVGANAIAFVWNDAFAL
jgi:hypothetical protein